MGTTLVVGAADGSGATTTAAGLAAAWASTECSTLAVDATTGGGDLKTRVGDATRVVERTAADVARLDWYVWCHSDAAVYDLGHRGLERDDTRALFGDHSSALVLTVSARPDALGRLRSALHTLALSVGECAVKRTSVVVTHQSPESPTFDPELLRESAEFDVAELVDLPYDPHLATGAVICPSALSAASMEAFERVRTGNHHTMCGTMTE